MLRLLYAVLYVWQPLTFARELLETLPSVGMRGAPAVVELTVHGLSALLSVAAASALWNASPLGPTLARFALVVAAALGVQSLYWSVLPGQTYPGDKLPLSVLVVLHAAIWLVYLQRSRRVRAMVESDAR